MSEGRALVEMAIEWCIEDLEGDLHAGDREEWVSRLIRDSRTTAAEAFAIADEVGAHARRHGLTVAEGQRLATEAREHACTMC